MNERTEQSSNISSAEMTAYWRSEHAISKDRLSGKMATPEGIEKSRQFEQKYKYPLVGRKVSVRARFFLDQAVGLLKTKRYDSCISFASGFSLLTYLIYQNIYQLIPSIKLIDTDLSEIIEARQRRLNQLNAAHLTNTASNIELRVLDLEIACANKLKLKEIFPTCQSPVFLIEGVIYFLSPECVQWLFSEISSYNNAAVILDYWSEEGVLKSKCFAQAVDDLRGFMKENVVSFFTQGFWSKKSFAGFTAAFKNTSDISILTAENDYSEIEGEKPQFADQDQFFPVQLFVGEIYHSPSAKL